MPYKNDDVQYSKQMDTLIHEIKTLRNDNNE